MFDVVDFLKANRYTFETLSNKIMEKIVFFENVNNEFYVMKLNQTLQFLEFAKKHSYYKAVDQTFSYIVNGGVREATSNEMEIAKNYLRENNVAINPYTVSTVLRRLIVGGDINSKYNKNCLSKNGKIDEYNLIK